ncbi:coenzyme PQQ synthesis protein D (pyrroloquinoline quinone biosynthesis protein D)(PqqD) [Ketogulonicigenium robustum]|uniref:Coenzyme PQQ synthesis protein D (Pyrroloquinoline quinone biosynthesis protein D)(PqqD) n=1 Tax=Ketogulonicigenium robustum TaxID=92947 RepID=A0A1W6P234_9RHOB|nr:pyrroloquinoline quinone biosynthesis peptide chaperone PqqD [Ketogulonicigenium robustum]ARO15494.1 coenzyme PQQ synthesis protein D (pyrroloquinoline quinone biosynthesis protein D)(PqqD) [Ketogulonicigenium robustum]
MASLTITEDLPLRLHRQVRLRWDKARGLWLLLAPEKILVPDETCVAVLQELDGGPLAGAIDRLAAKYNAPRDVIAADVIDVLQDLANRGYLLSEEPARHG